MKDGQTKLASFIEACLNTASGFFVSLLFWTLVVVPVWDLEVTMGENVAITMCFTVLSVARSYVWRRLFNAELPQKWAEAILEWTRKPSNDDRTHW